VTVEARHGRGPTILIVEDQPDLLATLADIFEARGFAVEVAPDATAAIERLEVADINVVLSDLGLPGVDGLALYRTIEQRWPDLAPRVVFMTARPPQSDVLDLVGRGQVPLVRKPFSVREIVRAVETVL
jgi:two-component system response regulator GlrR